MKHIIKTTITTIALLTAFSLTACSSMVDNSNNASFTVISNAEGKSVFEEGKWFLGEDKETKVQELTEDAMDIFGLD